ncbi:MAG: secondary thiamine-phosphate synthase enzyme YjbQ [Candidatus Omnitrophica bacterium]|nr:secondary thiamine-phosphate synthase enzyme YjbQ [Candidatus Omnitrophota bacterium]
MHMIKISTQHRNQIIDITPQIQQYLSQEKFHSGLLTVFSPHTTAGITVNENADPDVKRDMLSFLQKTIPQDNNFKHIEGNSDAHIKGSLINFSQNFIIENGEIQLGTWQGIFFVEFDGPRSREVWIKLLADKE